MLFSTVWLSTNILFNAAIHELFERLCDLPAAEASAELAAHPDRDAASQVARLLEVDGDASRFFATEGATAWLPMTEVGPDPERIGRYTIVGRIGAGGMGIVYAATEEHPRRTVALKVTHPALHTPQLVELFANEAQALAQVVHPNIPTIYEAGTTEDGTAYLSMELIHGVPLDVWRESTGPAVAEVLEALEAVCDAVAAVHAAGVLHRDLKPSNILMGPHGPRVLDFGIAASTEHTDRAGPHPGTVAFMSPEALRGDPLDERTDVYAMGVLLRMLTVDEGALPGLDDVIRRATEPELGRRTASAAALRHDLRCLRTHDALPWKTDFSYRTAVHWQRQRTRWFMAITGACLVFGIWGVGQWSSNRAVQRRETLASEHLSNLESKLVIAAHEGRWEEGTNEVRTFANDPIHAGSTAAHRVWAQWASMHGEGAPDAAPAWAEAFLASTDSTSRATALLHLGQTFESVGRLQDLAALADVTELPVELEAGVRRAAIARREFPEGILLELRKATPIGEAWNQNGWLDVDGDGVGELVQFTDDSMLLKGQLYDLPHPSGWTGIENLARWDGDIYLGSGNGRSPAGLYRVADTLEQVAILPKSTVQQVSAGTEGIWLARSYPVRGVSLFDGDLHTPHRPTDRLAADVMDVATVDVDDDGVDEVVVGVGAWAAYEVQVLEAAGDDWRVRSRASLGDHHDFVVVGSKLVAGKVNNLPNPRVFGRENPFGDPPGLVVYELDPLRQIRRIPLPVADDPRTTRIQSVEDPFVGDFDGDGRLDMAWTLREMHAEVENMLWLLFDVEGETRQHVITGLQAFGAEDRDGDGDSELLIGDENERLWILGMGTEALPIWTSRRERVVLDTPPTDDPLVARTFERSQVLADLGLLSAAGETLLSVQSQTSAPAELHSAARHAGQLFELSGNLDRAREAYARLQTSTEPWVDAFQRRALDLEGAQRLNPRLQRRRFTDLSRWHLQEPVFRQPGSMIEIDAFNDQDVLARIPVQVEDVPWVELHLGLQVPLIELGAGLRLSLERGDETLLTTGVWAQGGGGARQARLLCGAQQDEWIATPVVEPDVVFSVDLRVASGPQNGRCRGQVESGVHWRDLNASRPSPGPADLVLRVAGDPHYIPPTRVRASIRDLSTVGISQRLAQKSGHSEQIDALLAGRLDDVTEKRLRGWAALLDGDDAALEQALQDATVVTRRHLLRTDPARVQRILANQLGPDFPTEMVTVFREPSTSHMDSPITQAILLALGDAQMPVHQSDGRQLRIWRANAHRVRGELGGARLHARAVANHGARDGLTVSAMLMLEELEPGQQWGERAVELSPTPERTRARLRRLQSK